MRKKLIPARLPLPKFRDKEEAAEYFSTHSVEEIWDKLPEGKAPKLSSKVEKAIGERRKKAPISIRLDAEQIEAAKKIATAKSVGYQTQLRMWIAEGIRR